MWPGAEVFPILSWVAADIKRQAARAIFEGAFGVVAFVNVACRAREAFCGRHIAADERPVGRDDLLHLGFNRGEVRL